MQHSIFVNDPVTGVYTFSNPSSSTGTTVQTNEVFESTRLTGSGSQSYTSWDLDSTSAAGTATFKIGSTFPDFGRLSSTYEYTLNSQSQVICLKPDGVARGYDNWVQWALDRGVRIPTKAELMAHLTATNNAFEF